jgi:hypothetical protein
MRLLGRQVVDVTALVTAIEGEATTYRGCIADDREDQQRGRRQLKALHTAADGLAVELRSLQESTWDTMADALQERGYEPRAFIERLTEALELLGAVAMPPAGPGHPGTHERTWLLRQVRIRLEEHGVNVKSHAGARALSATLREVLKAVGEPVPTDMGPLLKEARGE